MRWGEASIRNDGSGVERHRAGMCASACVIARTLGATQLITVSGDSWTAPLHFENRTHRKDWIVVDRPQVFHHVVPPSERLPTEEAFLILGTSKEVVICH